MGHWMRLKTYLTSRIALVTAVCALLFIGIALAQALHDIRQESRGARQMQMLTAALLRLQTAESAELPAVLRDIRQLAEEEGLRHVQFELQDQRGQPVAQSSLGPGAGPVVRWMGEWLARINERAVASMEPLEWKLTRRDGQQWHAFLRPNLTSEQEEAAENLLTLVAMLLALVAALMVGVSLALRQALRPVSQILGGLGQLGQRNYAMRLGASPIDEIQVVNQAVNQLAESLKELESSRRTLSMKVLSLQEEERVRLARELHDELGQKLTVIRLNTGYLQKASGLNNEGQGALLDIAQATASIQQEVRDLLHRLRPQGLTHELDTREFERLVHGLVSGWQQVPGQTTRFGLSMELGQTRLDENILLALYRLTQEALTNVAKHAKASEVVVSMALTGSVLTWQVRDDGVGFVATPHALVAGNGLGGMQERVWSLGGSFQIDSNRGRGVVLSAEIPLHVSVPAGALPVAVPAVAADALPQPAPVVSRQRPGPLATVLSH